ncbi:MAG: ABC transporter ATP-binding protein [Actinobacteria bacterium]|nr:ABC transporter ATP-binding protein [Actinomycetota bacterium]
MSLIKFEKVCKIYKEGDDIVRALNNVSFEIEEGGFVSIMGPSGSGKSTLLSVLGVLNTPTDGNVFVDDIAVYNLKLEKQADFRSEYIGFIFQAFQLIPYLTAVENVMLPLTITKISSKKQGERAKEVLEKVGLGDKINRLPNQLSVGETQRVAVARAIVNEPPILLADEPTGNLDSKNADGVMELLKKLNQEGETIIMVTHDKNIAEHANYTIQLKDGQIVNRI